MVSLNLNQFWYTFFFGKLFYSALHEIFVKSRTLNIWDGFSKLFSLEMEQYYSYQTKTNTREIGESLPNNYVIESVFGWDLDSHETFQSRFS